MRVLLAILIGLTAGCSRPSDKSATTPAIRDAYATLANARTFGFGAEDGGEERPEETAFKVILSSPKAVDLLRKMFEEEESACAKLYALCGLRQLSRKTYQALSNQVHGDESVWTSFGCVVQEMKVEDVLSDLNDGHYQAYISELIVPNRAEHVHAP